MSTDKKLRIDLANMIKIISTFCRMETSLIHKDFTLTDKAMINLVDIMTQSLVTIFQVLSMQTVRFRRTRVTTLVTTEAHTRRIVLPPKCILKYVCNMKNVNNNDDNFSQQ